MTAAPALNESTEGGEVAGGFTLYCPWWPLGFEFIADDAHLLRLIRSMCSTTLSPRPFLPLTTRRIHVGSGRASVLRVRARGAGPTATVEGFKDEIWTHTCDSGCNVWWREQAADDTRVVSIDGQGVVWVAADAREAAALTGVRVARELLRTEVAALGGVELHAAFAVDPTLGGIVVAGASGAGKTTLALGIADAGGLLVSTDQTSLLRWYGITTGVGAPVSHRLRDGSMRRFDRGQPTRAPARDAVARFDGNAPNAKTWLTSGEIETFYGVPSAPASRVDLIVLAEATIGLARPSATLADRGRLIPLLAPVFIAKDPLRPTFWLRPEEPPSTPSRIKTLLDLVPEDVVVRLEWDPTVHAIEAAMACLRTEVPWKT